MQIEIKVIGDSDSPDVQNLLAHLARTTTATIAVAEPVAQAAPAAPESTKTRRTETRRTKKQEEAPVVSTASTAEVVSSNEEYAQYRPEEAPKCSPEQVRAAAVAKSSSGKREQVKALIESFGTPNLAGLESKDFNDFMAQLEKI